MRSPALEKQRPVEFVMLLSAEFLLFFQKSHFSTCLGCRAEAQFEQVALPQLQHRRSAQRLGLRLCQVSKPWEYSKEQLWELARQSRFVVEEHVFDMPFSNEKWIAASSVWTLFN